MERLTQTLSEMFPPAPVFTEKDLPDLSSKVYIVTGGASGVGKELCKMLYGRSATVYLAGRSQQNADDTISWIKSEVSDASGGTLEFLNLDLNDLSTIKGSAQAFLAQENRLDVVWHNAGVMMPPSGSKTKQGYELQLGTNVIAPWLFQSFLTPLMQRTAALPATPKDSVRVIWVSSIANIVSPAPGGINWPDINFENVGWAIPRLFTLKFETYGQSKAANIILGAEAVKRWSGSEILSISLNPGNLRTALMRHVSMKLLTPIMNLGLYEPYYGALTELFAGLSPRVDESRNGAYIIPWGRFGNPRSDIVSGYEENGPKLWDWIESECREFM
ncbi:NAD(P)-binding protein [Choiromyces venosus 120613-1]|uniref:NAD(P)-binding protein n=1 Tax=Choiromyces venosus 120613-1 TaxID=1336337 RepID=A0A3N4K6G8_9PEZI|nr:NAD(P)-binding protein [Choiromyces venosus 120613-1]